MGEALLITSGKGGVGKSTVSANLAYCLAQNGAKTVVIDLDMGLRSLDIMFGVENKIVYDVADVAEGLCRPRQALVKPREKLELYLMPASQTRDGASVSSLALEKTVAKCKEKFDFVLIDSPAGIGRGFKNAINCVDRVIIVSTTDAVAMRDAEKVAALAEKAGAQRAGIVLNRVAKGFSEETMREFEESCGTQALALVPEDPCISALSCKGITASEEKTLSAQAFERLAKRIRGEELPPEKPEKAGFMERIMSIFRHTH